MFPVDMSLCTLTIGSALSMVDGKQYAISATTQPVFGGSATHLVWVDGTIIPDIPQVKEASPGDTIDFLVPHVDQKGFTSPNGKLATGWAYKVQVSVGGRTWEKVVKPLVGQSSIDVDLQPSDEIAAPVYAPPVPVLSVNGRTGHVVLDPYLVVPLTDADDVNAVTASGTYTSPASPAAEMHWPTTTASVLDVRGARDVVLQTVSPLDNPAVTYRRTAVNQVWSEWASSTPVTGPTSSAVYVYAGDGSYEVR